VGLADDQFEGVLHRMRSLASLLRSLGLTITVLTAANLLGGTAFRVFANPWFSDSLGNLRFHSAWLWFPVLMLALCLCLWGCLLWFDVLSRRAKLLEAAAAAQAEFQRSSSDGSAVTYELLVARDLPLVPGQLGVPLYFVLSLLGLFWWTSATEGVLR
jgi:hypothetical protein